MGFSDIYWLWVILQWLISHIFFKRYDNCIFPSIGLLEISKADRIRHRSRGHFSLQHAEENVIVATPVQRLSFKPNESVIQACCWKTGNLSFHSNFDVICLSSLRQHLVLQTAFCPMDVTFTELPSQDL